LLWVRVMVYNATFNSIAEFQKDIFINIFQVSFVVFTP